MKTYKEFIAEAIAITEKGEGDKAAYDKFYKKMLAKFGVDSPEELDDDKKKEFFDAIDAGWESDDEEDGIDEAVTKK